MSFYINKLKTLAKFTKVPYKYFVLIFFFFDMHFEKQKDRQQKDRQQKGAHVPK